MTEETKSSGRPSGQRAPDNAIRVGGPARRLWKTVTKAVLGAGALAAAIGAVLALWPSPDPEDSASLSVRVISQVRLSEYSLRSSGGVAPDTASAPPFAVAASSRTVDLQDRQPTTPTPSPDDSELSRVPETGTARPTDPEATGEGVETMTQQAEEELTDDVLPILAEEDDGLAFGECVDGDCEFPMRAFVSATNEAVGSASPEPVVVAEELVDLFEQVRTVEDDPGNAEPLGVVVATDMELSGLRDQQVMLSWSIWPRDGEARLFGQWLATNPAYRLEATTDRDTGSLDVWIPLPREPGPYIVRMALARDGTNLASAETEPFD